MSVIGIDFGNESCYVAAAKAGGIETLANDYSLRGTPSCVAFAGKKRILGVPAKNQQVTNMKNTIGNFKQLIGRKFDDVQVQKELATAPYRAESRPDGSIGIRVNYLDQEHIFSPEQVTAMLFTKLKETSEAALKKPIKDCVLTVPSFFTNTERAALIDAANIAGLNILRLLNETTATALLYGFYKTDLPAPEEKPLNVVFVDFGHSQIQASVCAFNRGKLRMICSAWDQIGGRDIDAILANYFSSEILKKYRVDARKNPRAYLRLLTETEKLKKQMSANSTKLPLNIDCFIDEIDVTSSMSRTDMEDLCGNLFKNLENVLKKCFVDSKLTPDEIHAIEIVGGSTRIPLVKTLIEQVFGKPVNTTLNQDEAVSRGAALQCAILSPAVRVHDFGTTDIHNTPVRIQWDGEQRGELEVFQAFHAFPISRQITLHRREPFNMHLYYSDPTFRSDPFIGRWGVKNIKPTTTGESQEVRIKLRIDDNGLILVTSASIVEKKAIKEPETPPTSENAVPNPENGSNMDTTEDDLSDDGNTLPQPNNVQPQSPSSSSASGPGWTQRVKGWFSSAEDGKNKGKKKKSADLVELPLEGQSGGYSISEMDTYRNEELRMIENDEKEKERVDARNALEESVYDLRDKFSEDGPLSQYIENSNRQQLVQQLNDLENWLYEEGEDCNCDIYRGKLTDLQGQTDPVKARCFEYEQQPNIFSELGHTIQMARKHVGEIRTNTPKYEHITETEILNISEAADRAEKYLNENSARLQKTQRTVDPSVRVTDIRHEIQTLSTCLKSVLSRPKPKPPTPTPTGNDGSGDVNSSPNGDNKNQQQTKEDGPELTDDKMDVE